MNATQAREYLRAAVATKTGCALLRDLGYAGIISCPEGGDDESSILVAEALQAEIMRRYLRHTRGGERR